MAERLRTYFPLLLLFIFVCSLSACKKEGACITAEGPGVAKTFDLPLIESIDLQFVATVYITQDTSISESKLHIIAQKNVHDRIGVTRQDSKLVLAFTGCVKSHNPIEAYLTVKSLKQLAVNSAGDIIGETIITGEEIELAIGGLGDIQVLLQVPQVSSRIAGAGSIRAAGLCRRHDVEIIGSGSLNAFELQADSVFVDYRADGLVNIHALDRLEVDFGQPGRVSYRGNPVILSTGANGETVNANL